MLNIRNGSDKIGMLSFHNCNIVRLTLTMPALERGLWREDMGVLDAMSDFVHVVEAGGFAAAARSLGVPKSSLSRRVAQLEGSLNIRLLQRSSRGFNLTDAGRALYEQAAESLRAAEHAARAVASRAIEPRGRLKVTAPVSFGQRILTPIICDFMRRFEQVSVELILADRRIHLVEEGFDCAIRMGELEDSTLVARSIGTWDLVLCASPSYLKRRGAPTQPGELRNHDCVQTAVGPSRWLLTRGERKQTVAFEARARVEPVEALVAFVVAGLGIAVLPRAVADGQLARGELVQVLPDWQLPSVPGYLVYPSTRELSMTVRAFADQVIAQLEAARARHP